MEWGRRVPPYSPGWPRRPLTTPSGLRLVEVHLPQPPKSSQACTTVPGSFFSFIELKQAHLPRVCIVEAPSSGHSGSVNWTLLHGTLALGQALCSGERGVQKLAQPGRTVGSWHQVRLVRPGGIFLEVASGCTGQLISLLLAVPRQPPSHAGTHWLIWLSSHAKYIFVRKRSSQAC